MVDNELIRMTQAGDTEAFCQLIDKYERRIYHLAYRYCHNKLDAEDLSQEVWLKAYKSIHGYREESGFYIWLHKIAVNTFLNFKRSLSYKLSRLILRGNQGEDTGLEEMIDQSCILEGKPSTDFEENMHNKMLAERIMNSLGELSPKQRIIFLLKYQQDMNYKEISIILNCSQGTVKKSLFLAITKLRKHFYKLDTEAETLGYASLL